MLKSELLQYLPPFSNRYTTIRANQTVGDIVKEVLAAHESFAPDYDAIAPLFNVGGKLDIAKALFNFLKKNVAYKIESEEKQTTKSPAAMLTTAQGDCKHYAGFIAGVLDALNRSGKKIKWHYRFASYNVFDSLPGHVFVVMEDNGNEYWIDPVLKAFNERLEPTYILDKTPSNMLQRLSGIEEDAFIPTEDEDIDLSPEIMDAITLLYQYGVLNNEGQVNDGKILELSQTLPQEEFERIANARVLLHSQAISGFFTDIWRGVKKVSLAAPRNAYLSLVALNAFGYATKLKHALYNKDGSYNLQGKAKLDELWTKKFGGSFGNFENAIKSGMKKKAILGSTVGNPAAALPAWVAVASALIAAVTPLVSSLIRSQNAAGQLPQGIDPLTGLPYGMNMNPYDASSGGLMSFIQNNTALVVAAAAAGIYFYTKRSRS